MKGLLTPEQQLRVLSRVWGRRRGYVFLPWINGQAKSKEVRRKSYHEGRAYKWPAEQHEILEHIKAHDGDDLYFAPNLFKGKRRIEELVLPERVLYADLDPVDPSGLSDQPTIAWESSPERYQGVWILDSENEGASRPSRENHRLTMAIGADPSGWDPTQLLRVPGRPNYKFDYAPEDEPNGVAGRGLLWTSGPRYTWSDFADLPEVKVSTEPLVESLDESILEQTDRHEVWGRIKLKLPHRIRELYKLRILDPELDRSAVMWDIARSLADVGCTSLEIVALLRPTVWNKFRGRADELQRLMVTAQKAVNQREPEAIEEEEHKPTGITWLSDVAAQPIPRPQWLIRDIWTKGGCGFIAGAPKSYKSWFALDMAVSVATGTHFLGQSEYTTSEAPVLYLQEEDDLRLVMDRLTNIVEAKVPDRYWHGQLKMDRGRIMWHGPSKPIPLGLHVQTGFIASDPGWQSWLDEVIEQNKFALVIIDTLGTTAGEVDTDSSQELMNRLLKPLKVLAQKHVTSVCIVHHNKKAAGQGRAGNDMLGSIALHAWVDCALYARSKDVDGTISVEREAKMAPDHSFRVTVPFMHELPDGSRRLWEPEILPPGVGEEEAAAPARPKREPAIAKKLRTVGKRGINLKQLAMILDKEPGDVLNELLNAGEEYVIEREGLWFPVTRA